MDSTAVLERVRAVDFARTRVFVLFRDGLVSCRKGQNVSINAASSRSAQDQGHRRPYYPRSDESNTKARIVRPRKSDGLPRRNGRRR